jgi:hypothetical protein
MGLGSGHSATTALTAASQNRAPIVRNAKNDLRSGSGGRKAQPRFRIAHDRRLCVAGRDHWCSARTCRRGLRPSAGGTPGPVQFGENRNTEKVLAECFHAISDVNAVPSFARLDLGSGRFARSPAPEDFRSAFLVDLDHAGKTPLRTFLDPTVEGATVFELELGFAFLAEAEVCTEAFHWH